MKNIDSLVSVRLCSPNASTPARRALYKIATFADFAQNVMPDVKWLDDYKRLRTFEEQLKKAKDEPVGA